MHIKDATKKHQIDGRTYKLTTAGRDVMDATGVTLDDYLYDDSHFVGAQNNGFETHDDFMMEAGKQLGYLAFFKSAVADGNPQFEEAARSARDKLQEYLAHNVTLGEPAEDFVKAVEQAIDLRLEAMQSERPAARSR